MSYWREEMAVSSAPRPSASPSLLRIGARPLPLSSPVTPGPPLLVSSGSPVHLVWSLQSSALGCGEPLLFNGNS